MRKFKNILWLISLCATLLFLLLGVICLITEDWDGINLYIILLQTMFLLTLFSKNVPFSYKLLLTVFNGCLLARNIYTVDTLDISVLTVWLTAILQPIGLWVKYKKK